MAIINILGKTTGAPSPSRGWDLNSYQQVILDAVENSDENLQIEAVAGSGKTATLELICHGMSSRYASQKILVVAFNKVIADTLRDKLPWFVQSQTLHSLGFAICKANLGILKVNKFKVANAFKGHLNETNEDREFYFDHYKNVVKMVGLFKANMIEPTEENFLPTCRDFEIRYGLEVPGSNRPRKIAYETLLECMDWDIPKYGRFIDFDDMIWLPLKLEMDFPQYDLIMVDESQDLNANQQEFIERLAE